MVLEVAELNIRKGESENFERDFLKAEKIIRSMSGYISHELKKNVEVPDRYLLLVHWESLEDHKIGFRKSPAYQRWKDLLHHYYEPFPEVQYYQ